MNTFSLIAATLIAAATSPVVARDARPAGGATLTAGAPANTPARTASPATRYCVIDTPLGTRIQHKTCMTRQEWIDTTGQDPLAKD
jgi:hypothetical protein